MKKDSKQLLFENMKKINPEFILKEDYMQEVAQPKPTRLDPITRKRVMKDLSAMPDYFVGIPIEEIDAVLNKNGLLLLQEDNTPWDGLFTGAEGHAQIAIGYLNTKTQVNGLDSYTPIENSMLIMTWYKMQSGKYEIVTYLS
jgi:hypothetical protein